MFICVSARGSFVSLCAYVCSSNFFFCLRDLDYLEGEVASRGTVAQGRRSPQARCSSALKGLEVPSLLDRVRFSVRNERITWFFDTWGGGHPLASPRGGIDYDGS